MRRFFEISTCNSVKYIVCLWQRCIKNTGSIKIITIIKTNRVVFLRIITQGNLLLIRNYGNQYSIMADGIITVMATRASGCLTQVTLLGTLQVNTIVGVDMTLPWWRHQRETFSESLALCAGNSPVTGEFPLQRPVTRSFDVFFDLRLN